MVAVVLGAGACGRPQPAPGEATLQVHGASLVHVRRADGPARAVVGERTVTRGDVVSVGSGGATLVLHGGAAVELREGSELTVRRRPELRGGDVLAVSGDRPLTLEAAATSLTVAGAAKLSRSLAVSASSFHGSVEVASAGRVLRVPALRQATIPAFGLVPPRAVPLAYDVADPWDRRFLGLAMELTDVLQSYSDGFSGLPRARNGLDPDELAALLPQLPPAPVGELLAERRSPGEALVGAAVVASTGTRSIAERWREVFGFRDEGAVWGLVVLDQAISDPSSVLDLIGEASRRFFDPGVLAVVVGGDALEAGPPPAPPATAPAGPTTTTTAAPPKPAVTSPVTVPAPPVTLPPITLPPVTVPPVTVPPVTVPSLDPVADAVVGLVDNVAGTVPSLLP